MRGMSHYLGFYTEILNTKLWIKRSWLIELITIVQLYDHLNQWLELATATSLLQSQEKCLPYKVRQEALDAWEFLQWLANWLAQSWQSSKYLVELYTSQTRHSDNSSHFGPFQNGSSMGLSKASPGEVSCPSSSSNSSYVPRLTGFVWPRSYSLSPLLSSYRRS